jgi:hypothetical protein
VPHAINMGGILRSTVSFLVSLASSEGWPTWQKIEFYSHLIEGNIFKTTSTKQYYFYHRKLSVKISGGYTQSVSVLTI